MDNLKQHIHKQQKALRQLALQYATQHPQNDDRLDAQINASEKLLDELALHMAKLNQRLEMAYPQWTQRFLQQVQPSLLWPYPSEIVVSAGSTNHSRLVTLSRDHEFQIEDTPFRALQTIDLLPIHLISAKHTLKHHRRSLKLRFGLFTSSVNLKQLNGRHLKLLITASHYADAVNLWSALCFEHAQVKLNGETVLAKPTMPIDTPRQFDALICYFRQPEALLQIEIGPLYFAEEGNTFQIEFEFRQNSQELADVSEDNFRLNPFRAIQIQDSTARPIEHGGCQVRYPLRLEKSDEQLFKVEKVSALNRQSRKNKSLQAYSPGVDNNAPYYQLVESDIEIHNLISTPQNSEILSIDCLSYQPNLTLKANSCGNSLYKGYQFKTTCQNSKALPSQMQSPQLWDGVNQISQHFRAFDRLENWQALLQNHRYFASHSSHSQHWAKCLNDIITNHEQQKQSRYIQRNLLQGYLSQITVDDGYFINSADCDLLGFVLTYIAADCAPYNSFHHLEWKHQRTGITRLWQL